eukprot:scaffold45935_cov75-Phaeocystis_antarctica.AAC.2
MEGGGGEKGGEKGGGKGGGKGGSSGGRGEWELCDDEARAQAQVGASLSRGASRAAMPHG